MVLILGLTVFILLFRYKAQAGNEELIQQINKQNEKIHQMADAVLKLQEKTTTLELELKTVKQRQEEDAKKFNDIISQQQSEIKVWREEVSICEEQRNDTELEMKINNEEIMVKIEEQNNKMNALQKDVIILNKTTVEEQNNKMNALQKDVIILN